MKLSSNHNHCDNVRTPPLLLSANQFDRNDSVILKCVGKVDVRPDVPLSNSKRQHASSELSLPVRSHFWHICNSVVFMLPRSVEPQRAISRNDMAEPESLAGGCSDSNIEKLLALRSQTSGNRSSKCH